MISFRNPTLRFSDLNKWAKIWPKFNKNLGWTWEWSNGDLYLHDEEIHIWNPETKVPDQAVPLPSVSVMLTMAQRLSETSMQSIEPTLTEISHKRLIDAWERHSKETPSENTRN